MSGMLGPGEDDLPPFDLMLARQDTEGARPAPEPEAPRAVNVLMVGTGEYTTGYVHGKASDSDKGAGVVALTMIDLRRRGKVHRLGLCGTNGEKMPGIRAHMQKAIGETYRGMDLRMDTFPEDGVRDSQAYLSAIEYFQPGDVVTIFTPDDTHFEIAMACIKKGLHVLVTKPIVKTLEEHIQLEQAAKEHNVLVCVEVHKRWDPIYVDARDRIRAQLGGFSFIHSYMSQPKHQLETFKAWAGKSSDISYYLNSHHIDFHEWCVGEKSRPIRVTACASTGVAKAAYDIDTEDTITLTVQWENLADGSLGTAVYTSSWIAAKSDVHSQQRFFYMGHEGEVIVDQAHRGYSTADHANGFRSVNPLFMKYTPTDGKFSGQLGYGYRSFELFIDAAMAVNSGECSPEEFDNELATVATTLRTTAILEAGRRSLDNVGRPVEILYEHAADPCRPTDLRLASY